MSVNIGTVACMDAGFTQKETAVKVLEEAAEAFAAWQKCRDYEDSGGDLSKDGYPLSDLISECADVIQAVCDLLDMMGVHDMRQAMAACKQRNEARGRVYEPEKPSATDSLPNAAQLTIKRLEQELADYKGNAEGFINGKKGFSFCDDCRQKNLLKTKWENEQFLQEEITCPWCGYKEPDSWEFGEGFDDSYECSRCGKRFEVEADVTVEYTSKRRVDDMPEGWCVNG